MRTSSLHTAGYSSILFPFEQFYNWLYWLLHMAISFGLWMHLFLTCQRQSQNDCFTRIKSGFFGNFFWLKYVSCDLIGVDFLHLFCPYHFESIWVYKNWMSHFLMRTDGLIYALFTAKLHIYKKHIKILLTAAHTCVLCQFFQLDLTTFVHICNEK